MGDLLGSLGAIAAAVVIKFTGWTAIDPILSVFVAILILRSAWKLLAKSVHILLEDAPEGASPELVKNSLMKHVPGLAAVSHVHVWQLTSGRTMATLHIHVYKPGSENAVVKLVQKDEFSLVRHASNLTV